MTTCFALLEFHDPAWVYISLPIAAAVVGYVTKLVAIRMMFEPLEFRGIPPYLGWQGQIPRRAGKMAAVAVDSLTSGIIDPEELFDRIDTDELIARLEPAMRDSAGEIVEEVLVAHRPGLWNAMPVVARAALVARVQGRTPEAMRRMFDEVRANVDQYFDLKHMVVSNLVRDKVLLNRMFQDMATPEFRFIARSGIVTGFTVGVVQMVVYGVTGAHIVLPLFGLLTGGLTDYLALTLIFRPKRRRRMLGPIRWQGLFHARRAEVTQIYGELMAKDILSPRAILDSMLTGPASDRLFEMIDQEVQRTVDAQAGLARPLVSALLGGERYAAMKQDVAAKAIERLPETTAAVESYAAEALDLRHLIVERMADLDTDSYEGLLRPAFKDDEWVIVAVGAMLGFLVGELQVQLITAWA